MPLPAAAPCDRPDERRADLSAPEPPVALEAIEPLVGCAVLAPHRVGYFARRREVSRSHSVDEEYHLLAAGYKYRQRVEIELGERPIPELDQRTDVELISSRNGSETEPTNRDTPVRE